MCLHAVRSAYAMRAACFAFFHSRLSLHTFPFISCGCPAVRGVITQLLAKCTCTAI